MLVVSFLHQILDYPSFFFFGNDHFAITIAGFTGNITIVAMVARISALAVTIWTVDPFAIKRLFKVLIKPAPGVEIHMVDGFHHGQFSSHF